jgi:hypothetical protein
MINSYEAGVGGVVGLGVGCLVLPAYLYFLARVGHQPVNVYSIASLHRQPAGTGLSPWVQG